MRGGLIVFDCRSTYLYHGKQILSAILWSNRWSTGGITGGQGGVKEIPIGYRVADMGNNRVSKQKTNIELN